MTSKALASPIGSRHACCVSTLAGFFLVDFVSISVGESAVETIN